MRLSAVSWLVPVILIGSILRPAQADISDQEVRATIEQAVKYLLRAQTKRGSWSGHSNQPGGVTSLVTLALLNAGVEPKHPAMQKSLNYLRSLGKPTMTYSTALQTMVFCQAEPKKDLALIRRNAGILQGLQITKGPKKGAWDYSAKKNNGDNSNTQFALLALHEAEQVGITIRDDTWRLTLAYWLKSQLPDGSWSYDPARQGLTGSGSMTCAGISSLVIAADKILSGDADVLDGNVQCCGQQQDYEALEKAFAWLGAHFSVRRNPRTFAQENPRAGQVWRFYYLYGIERVGRLTGRRFIGKHDWYREGVETLLAAQKQSFSGNWKGMMGESDPVIATSLALLFLSKGRRPVLIGKLKYGDHNQWNLHRHDLANLTRYVEQQWQRDLTWQVIDAAVAGPADLLQTPVLYISGREELRLATAQKENLRKYVDQGGFIFAENCCAGDGFDKDFRQLMSEIFPESPLRLLPPDHPVWYAQQRVDPKYIRPLFGIDACCRTSVVYCPENLSCYWELGHTRRVKKYPQAIQDEIAACYAIGANVVTYATGRQLKEKLDIPQAISSEAGQESLRGALEVAKIQHSGGSDDAPAALSNLLSVFTEKLKVRVNRQKVLLSLDDSRLADYPIAYMHGRRAFRFTPTQRKALSTYIERGGFLFADAICSSKPFADSFYREMKEIFPSATLQRIPSDHPLLSTEYRGFDLSSVMLRDPQQRKPGSPLQAKQYATAPLLEGIQVEGRYVVIFSPYDLSCALENGTSLQCKGYLRADAAKIGMNLLLYALQQ